VRAAVGALAGHREVSGAGDPPARDDRAAEALERGARVRREEGVDPKVAAEDVQLLAADPARQVRQVPGGQPPDEAGEEANEPKLGAEAHGFSAD
jgi:hypothetical protein